MPKSSPDIQMPPKLSSEGTLSPTQIRLTIRGLGNVPSFKNTKSIYRNHKTGRPFIATKKEYKETMQQIIRSIESQLCSAFQTSTAAMPTAPSLAFWIASSLPLDDSRQWIPAISALAVKVEPGDEGCDILIERL